MPGEATTIGAGIALDALNGRATQTARSTWIALLTSAATDATTMATMAEMTTTGYARQPVTWSAPTGDPAISKNTGVLTFGPFTADPPSIGFLGLVTAATGTAGSLLYRWTADVARDGISGDSIVIAIDALTMSLD